MEIRFRLFSSGVVRSAIIRRAAYSKRESLNVNPLMNETRLDILDWLLSRGKTINPEPIKSLGEWKALYDQNNKACSESVDRAVVGGFLADRVAYAFAGGYHSALQRLTTSVPVEAIPAICVTEKGGGHPKAIQARLEKKAADASDNSPWVLNGFKSFVTCAKEADVLLIAVSTGANKEGQNRLRMVQLDRETPGMAINPMKDLPYIPEISHGTVRLENVEVGDSQLLPGDGYADFIKPFRTIEDLHIMAAILGYQFRTACQFSWPADLREQLLSLLVSIRPLAMADPKAPAVHIAFAGLQKHIANSAIDLASYWEKTPDDVKKAWERDKGLMSISKKAGGQRLESAWAHYQ